MPRIPRLVIVSMKKEEDPTPRLATRPTPSPEEQKKRVEATKIEQQIQQVYQKSRIEYRQVGGTKKAFYVPSKPQRETIIALAQQLPPEKRKKYITEGPMEEEAKGIGETLAQVSIQDPIAHFTSMITGTPVGRVRQIQEMQKKTVPPSLRPVEPIKEVGGVIASIEAPVYTVGRLAGVKTPRPPPTLTGGLIGVAIGDPRELEQVKAYGPGYARGTMLGDVAVSMAMSWVAGKAWGGLKRIPVVKRGPIYTEKVAAKLIVKLPDPIQKLLLREEVVGYKRTPSMIISRSESWAKGTKIVSGTVHTPYAKTLAKVGKIQMLTPPFTESLQRILPELTFRTIVTPTTQTITTPFLRTLLVAPLLLPSKMLRSDIIQKQKITSRTIQVPKSVQRLAQFQQIKQIQSLDLEQVQKQLQKQIQLLSQLQLQQQKVVPRMRYRFPRVFRERKVRDPLFGAWFPRKHKIATPEQVHRAFFGEPRKKKRKRKRKGKRRRKRTLRFVL